MCPGFHFNFFLFSGKLVSSAFFRQLSWPYPWHPSLQTEVFLGGVPAVKPTWPVVSRLSSFRILPLVHLKSSGPAACPGLWVVLLFHGGFYADLLIQTAIANWAWRVLRPALLTIPEFGVCSLLSGWEQLGGRKGMLLNLNRPLQGQDIKKKSCCQPVTVCRFLRAGTGLCLNFLSSVCLQHSLPPLAH